MLEHVPSLMIKRSFLGEAERFFHRINNALSRLLVVILLVAVGPLNVVELIVLILVFVPVVPLRHRVFSRVDFAAQEARTSIFIVVFIVWPLCAETCVFFTFFALLLLARNFRRKLGWEVVKVAHDAGEHQVVAEGDSEGEADQVERVEQAAKFGQNVDQVVLVALVLVVDKTLLEHVLAYRQICQVYRAVVLRVERVAQLVEGEIIVGER